MDSILEFVEQRGGRFVGFFSVSFPVYVIHVEYDSVDTDPFYPLYKALLRYTQKDPKHENLSYFASLTGFERPLLTTCIRHLKEEGMLRWHLDHFVVTADAEKKYLTANSRPTVRVSGSFIVDGKDLSFLPEFIYSGKRDLARFCGEVSPHLPVDISIRTAQAEKLIHSLEKGVVKEMLHLESSGTNFEIVGYDKRFLKGANAVFFYDAGYTLNKVLMYGNSPIECTALELPTAYSIIMRNDNKEWLFSANKGYNVGSEKEIKKLALIAPNEGISYVIQQRYKLTDNYVIRLKVDDKTGLPIIVIDEALLFESQDPEAVINDAKNKFIDFPIEQQGIIRLSLSHNIQNYIDFVNNILDWDLAGKKDGVQFRSYLEKIYPDWRKLLVMLKKYDILEAIDRACFILNRKEF